MTIKLTTPSTISDFTVRRLSIYYHILDELNQNGVTVVSSETLGELSRVTSAQVRKDLSLFGNFGRRGLGYTVPELKEKLARILGLHQQWKIALIGAGNLGSALCSYKNFKRQGFEIVAVFDKHPAKVGQMWNQLKIQHMDEFSDTVQALSVTIAIIAVPLSEAQAVADIVVASGIQSILNFAPRTLIVPSNVQLRNVNLAIELEGLTYHLTHEHRPSPLG
ncbi:MAG: redox-sensing transcriptional repressor Rex [Gemmatimonadetes bacterium]|nr:MAG: redox-sensing transcriptional repressor Rex [Gemmatimonadota bacterium]